jgi:Xaa-Pro dipeptidase
MTHQAIFTGRQASMLDAMAQNHADVLVLNAGPTLTYLTGYHFHLSERPILALFQQGEKPVIVLPELEAAKVGSEATAFTYRERLSTWVEAARAAIHEVGLRGKRTAFEPVRFRLLERNLLVQAGLALDEELDAGPLVAAVRAIKDEVELDLMQHAVEMAQTALRNTLPQISLGVTERAVAGIITQELLKAGSEPELPFNPIIAFGPQAANPHAVPSDYALQQGDVVLIDWGANHQGYFSDLTRTFTYGAPSDEVRTIARLVGEANQAGRDACKPKVPIGTVDAATRAVITQGGYGAQFVHRTGHGLGLEVHEAPWVRDDNEQLMEPGMTFTVEPGIYINGVAGVRIEDDVVITPDGHRSLSTLPREVIDLSQGLPR